MLELPYEIDLEKFGLVLQSGLRKMFCTEEEVIAGMTLIKAYLQEVGEITGAGPNETITAILFGYLVESILKISAQEMIIRTVHKEMHDAEKRESDARRN